MNTTRLLCLCLFALSFFSLPAQCPDCGNGVVNGGETPLNCPQDVAHPATCTSPCGQPAPFETTNGIRQSYDFVGNTSWSTTGLPFGWSFARAPSPTTAATLFGAGTDAYGAKAGLIQPNCSGSCTFTNGFCIGNLASSSFVGGGGSGGKLGANFDGRANVNQNLSYAVLRGQGNPTLVSPTYNMSSVNGFKVQFWLFPSETSCGQLNSWGSCVGNNAYLDFSTNGGSSWTQVLTMNLSTTSSNMCFNNSSNTLWLNGSRWSRVCLTVFKNNSAPGNFYPAATSNTAASGMMVNSAYFSFNFKFRVRYAQSGSCTSGITSTNPGRYLAIDYPVVTSGNQMIPCGLSFINMCGYGADNNDDGVGSSISTSTTTAFGTVRRGVNQAERGVEIFRSQNASYGSQNLSGSNFATNYDLCNAEGGDQQCIDWRSNNNLYMVVYEVLSDMEVPTSSPPSVQYYEGGSARSVQMSKVTSFGKTPTVGWRYSAFRTVMCGNGGGSDLNPGCNGYSFLCQTPTNLSRGFYNLAVNSLGRAWCFYGATSCSNYFNGPFVAPIAVPDTLNGSGNYTICDGNGDLVFTGLSDFCSNPSGFSGSGSLSITGPNGFSETITSGGQGVNPITDPGTYVVTAQTPTTPTQCVDCGRSACITITAQDITNCTGFSIPELSFWASPLEKEGLALNWSFPESQTDRFHHFEVQSRKHNSTFVTRESLSAQPGQLAYTWTDPRAHSGRMEYRLLAINTNGQSDFSEIVSVDFSHRPLSTLWPNPTQGILNLSFSIESTSFDLEISDITGRALLKKTVSSNTTRLDLSHFPKGIYFLKVRAAGRVGI